MSIINTADIGKLKKTKVAKAGDTMTGTLAFGDNVKATFGALAGGDLQIFHDGSNTYINEVGTGDLLLSSGNAFKVRSADGVSTGAVFNAYGSVDLNYNNVNKLATTATGVDVTGTITCDGFTSADASSTFSNSASNLEVNFIANNSVIINTTSGTSEGTIIRCNKYYRIDTGGSVERLRIDASGNVGIGTNNPTNLLTCESTTSPQVSIKYDTTNYLNISHNKFEVVGSDFTINAFNSQSVILQTSNIERVRIDSSGNMGIGTTSPTSKLDVAGTVTIGNGASIIAPIAQFSGLTVGDGSGANSGITLYSSTTSSHGIGFADANSGDDRHRGQIKYDHVGNTMSFKANNATSLTVKSTGIDVTGSVTTDYVSMAARYLEFDHSIPGAGGHIRTTGANSLIFGVGTSEKMRIDSSGNVGIGTSSPSELLHLVSGASAKPVIRLENNVSANADPRIVFCDSVENYGFSVGIDDSGNRFSIAYDGTGTQPVAGTDDKFVIASSGNVGIGTSTPTSKLDVVGTLATTGTISSGGNIKTGTDTGRIFCGASNDLQIYHDGSDSWIQDAGTGILGLKTDGVGISMLTSTGDTMFQANRDGAVNLYYDNAQKLATTTTGINVTGSVTATSLSLDNGVATIDSGTGTVSNAEMTLDTWAATEFQSAKYTITARGNGNKFQTSEILVFHDNANTAYITEYGIMSSDGTPFVTYLVDVTSGNVRLRATLDAAWSGGDNVKFTRFAQDII